MRAVMTEREIPRLVRDLIYAQEHHLVDDEPARAAVQALQHGVVDDLVRSLIQGPVRKHRIAQAFVGPFALPRLEHGDLVLGIDLRGRPIRFPSQYLNRIQPGTQFIYYRGSLRANRKKSNPEYFGRATQLGRRYRGS